MKSRLRDFDSILPGTVVKGQRIPLRLIKYVGSATCLGMHMQTHAGACVCMYIHAGIVCVCELMSESARTIDSHVYVCKLFWQSLTHSFSLDICFDCSDSTILIMIS